MSDLVTLEEKPSSRFRNPWRHLPSLRWGVQAAYLAFLTLVGVEFWLFYEEAVAGRTPSVGRPPAVEAFLPISALVGLKRFTLTGNWDAIHPAGLTILLAALASALLARKFFCGWVCPVGTISRGLEWLGKKLFWRRGWPRVPRALDYGLASLKYLLLAFFLWTILGGMPLEALDEFVESPYNLAADAKMLLFFGSLSATAALVLLGLAALSLVVKNLWCRYLCPYGALLGLASWFSPVRVVRYAPDCNDCQACSRACPVEIPVAKRLSVANPECTGCLSCVAACTVPDVLTVTRQRKGLSPWLVSALGVATMLGFWAVARASGHWASLVPAEVFARVYRVAPLLGH